MQQPRLPLLADAVDAAAAHPAFRPHTRPTIGCAHCGTLQRLPATTDWTTADCSVCRSVIERRTGRSLSAALACSSAALVLFLPAALFPLPHHLHPRRLPPKPALFERDGHGRQRLARPGRGDRPVRDRVPGAPLRPVDGRARDAPLQPHRPAWLGRAFRWANALEPWAMADVFVLALAVAYGKLVSQLSVEVGIGARCFIGLAVLGLFLRATLDRGAVWQAIGEPAASLPSSRLPPPLACTACELPVPADREGSDCPRCAATLQRRKPNAVARAVALTVAATLLYIPANIYPMASIPTGLSTDTYTVMGGVIELWDSQLYSLAALVIVASVVIPVLKLIGLAWCVASVLRRSTRHLVAKTRVYGFVEEIGRWSMVDPFVIACFVPVSQFNALVYGRAESAAPAFTAVVILTVFAARAFDPRLMWDVTRNPRT